MRSAILFAWVVVAPSVLAGQAGAGMARPLPVTPPAFEPHVQPTLRVERVAGEIVIDGKLDDEGWEDAAQATGFAEFQPREDVAAPIPIEAWVTYDESTLYVAFRVTDDPKSVRASLGSRDNVLDDDVVAIVLDPFGNNAIGYLIGANPLGVQVDMRITASSEDLSFDLLYESAGRITETGYEVELAIPFSSLQFPRAHEQEWRVNFIKLHPRSTRRQYAWGRLTQNIACLLCQNGHLTGLEGIRAGSRIELLPSLVATQAGGLEDASDPRSFRNASPSAEVSLGIRYPFRPGWTVEGTYNPDFSQVESDAAQIDVNTTYALSYPERRPFFQEGAELFETNIRQVYTRAINSPVGATKLVGRQGGFSVGYIGAVDERTPILVPLEERTLFVGGDRSVSNILRLQQTVGEGSHVGALVTDRRYQGGGSGSTVGADARIRLGGNWQISAQIVASHTAEPETGDLADRDLTFGDDGYTVAFDGETFTGRAFHLGVNRFARGLGLGASYREASPTFRTADGFQSRNDYRNASAYTQWSRYPEDSFVDRFIVSLQGNQGWNFDGELREQYLAPSAHLTITGPTYINAGLRHGQERFDGHRFRSLTTGWANVYANFNEAVSLGVSASGGDWILRAFGNPQLGRGLAASLNGELKPTSRLVIAPSAAYQRMDDRDGNELFAGYVARSRMTYQFTRELFARVVVQYNDFKETFTFEPLLMYRLNPLSIVYVGSSHGYTAFDEPYGFEQTNRQLFVKVQYLLR
jgi:hypothetical protein